MIYVYYLLLSGLLLLSQSRQISTTFKIITTHEFLGALVKFSEARPDSEEEQESDGSLEVNREKRLIRETGIKPEAKSTTIYFYKKISAELQL